jgi:hypothetical protein
VDDYFDSVRAQLVELCDQGAHRRWWRRIALPSFAAPAVAVAASALVVIAVIAFAFSTRSGSPNRGAPGRPSVTVRPYSVPGDLSPHQQQQARSYVSAVLASPYGRSCLRRVTAANVSQGSPSAAILSTLGVLRRPATATDQLPGGFGHSLFATAGKGAYVNYIRRARVAFGDSYYVIPIAHAGYFSARCQAELTASLRLELRHVLNPLRASTLAFGTRAITREGIHPGVLVDAVGHDGSGGGGSSANAIEKYGGDFATTGITKRSAILSGLVHDGVASVQIYYPATRSGPQRSHAVSITTRPVENLIVVKVPRGAEGAFPDKMIWRSAEDTLIKTIDESG